jgi:cobalamin biosynthesis protein CobD/CbiB
VQNNPRRFAACGRGRFSRQNTGRRQMPQKLRSFIGTILIICLVLIYALLATTIATLTLATYPWWVHLFYFMFSGLLWILPAMLIIKWMAGPVSKKN